MGFGNPKHEDIRAIVEKACGRREMVMLVTPFLRFESHFASMDETEFSVVATMSREDAVYGLRTPELLIRFPEGLGFYEANVKMLGLGLQDGKRTIRFAMPTQIKESEQRGAYRVERLGKVEATFSTDRHALHQATVIDLSVSGARLRLMTDVLGNGLTVGDCLRVDLALNETIHIATGAQVKHLQGRIIGIQYDPPLTEATYGPLSQWVFARREEDLERLAQRLDASFKPSPSKGVGLPTGAVVLLSTDATLEKNLEGALGSSFPLVRVAPSVQALKDAFSNEPLLLVSHVEGAKLDERRRMKTLVEMAHKRMPVLLLGTDVDGASLFELASEWKASSAMVWSPTRSAFFQRLTQGMIRRHRNAGEAPVAPKE